MAEFENHTHDGIVSGANLMAESELLLADGTLESSSKLIARANVPFQKQLEGDDCLQEFEDEDEAMIQDSLNWKKHLTVRAIITGSILGVIGGICLLQIALISPITPSLNVVFSMFSFVVIRTIIKMGCSAMPLTKQENTIAQTLAMTACAGGVSLGYSTWYVALTPGLAAKSGLGQSAFIPNTENFGILIGTSFSVLLPGVFLLTFLTKYFVTHPTLVFPSGTASGITLNSFHDGGEKAKAFVQSQLVCFAKWFCFAFMWGMVTSVFGMPQGPKADFCGAGAGWNLLGNTIASLNNGFGNWDLNIIFVGVGMMLPLDFVWSIIIGMFVVSFGYWPWIASKGIDLPYASGTAQWTTEQQAIANAQGAWYSSSDKMLDGDDTPSMRGEYAFHVFTFALMLLGEGVFVICQVVYDTYRALRKPSTNQVDVKSKSMRADSGSGSPESLEDVKLSIDELRAARRRFAVLDRGQPITKKLSLLLFVSSISMATLIMSLIYPVEWWIVLISFFIIAPFIAIPNVYFIGLQDQDVSAIIGKVPMFLLPMLAASVAGDPDQGIIPGLVAMGALMGICGQSGFLMQDFKTAYITETSPKAMFFGQLIGTMVAVVFGPLTWILFNAAFPVLGVSGRFAKLANGPAYRAIATVGAYGVDILPDNCLLVTLISFALAFCMAVAREFLPGLIRKTKFHKYAWLVRFVIPSPTAIGLATYVGVANGNSDYPFGALAGLVWKFFSLTDYQKYHRIVASSFISGGSIATLLAGIVTIFGADMAYFCLQFNNVP